MRVRRAVVVRLVLPRLYHPRPMATPVVAQPSNAPTSAPTNDVAHARRAGLRRLPWPLLTLLTLAAILRLALWDRAYGFEQGDPVEYVNIAYRIAFGVGIEWWDLRPLLLSLLYVPVMLVMQWWPDPTGEAMVRALPLVGVLFSLGSVVVTYAIGRRLGGEIVGLTAGLLVAVNPVFNRLSVTTFAEVPSTFFVLLVVWLLVRSGHGADSAADGVGDGSMCAARRAFLDSVTLAGLALGLGCMIRYQAIA